MNADDAYLSEIGHRICVLRVGSHLQELQCFSVILWHTAHTLVVYLADRDLCQRVAVLGEHLIVLNHVRIERRVGRRILVFVEQSLALDDSARNGGHRLLHLLCDLTVELERPLTVLLHVDAVPVPVAERHLSVGVVGGRRYGVVEQCTSLAWLEEGAAGIEESVELERE